MAYAFATKKFYLKKNSTPVLHLIHPTKNPPRNDNTGRKTETFAFKSAEDIAKISQHLFTKSSTKPIYRYRNYLYFSLGINMGFRGSDLVSLKWGDIFIPHTSVFNNQDWNSAIEQKTHKSRQVVVNYSAQKAILFYLRITNVAPESLDPDQYVFPSRKHGTHISANSMYCIIKDAALACGIPFNVGNHSMRKTFGYNLYNTSNDIALVQRVLNHSNPLITTHYIGIDQERTRDAYNNMEDLVWTPQGG